MEIQQLRFFIAVADEGNLTKASKKIGTVQSNTTAKIKQLEYELGHKLFHRSKKGMQLSEKGMTLMSYARKIIELEKNALKEISKDIEPVGKFSIGALDTFIRLYLNDAISKFVVSYPDVDFMIQTGFNPILFQRLKDNELDFAGVVGEYPISEFEAVFSKKEKMVLLSSSKSLERLPLLILGKECFFGQTLQEYFNHSRAVLNIASIETILNCVRDGIGISLLPLSLIPKNYTHLVQKTLTEKCNYSLIRKRENPWLASEKEFLKLVKTID